MSTSAGPSVPSSTPGGIGVQWTAPAETTWHDTACTCGNGDEVIEHYLRCAKWVAVLSNHVDRKGSR